MYLGSLSDDVDLSKAPWQDVNYDEPGSPLGNNAVLAVVVAREALDSLGAPRNRTLEIFHPWPGGGGEGAGGDYWAEMHPDLKGWLRSKGYKLRLAPTASADGRSGVNYAGIFDSSGKLLGARGHAWNNKTPFIGKVVLGTLAAMAGAAAVSAIGGAGATAGAGAGATSGGAAALPTAAEVGAAGGSAAGAAGTAAATAIPSASGLIPAATAALPAASALKSAAPSAATGGAIAPPAAAAAPPVTATSAGSIIPTVMKAVPAVTSAVKAVQAVQSAQTRASAQPQMPIAPPANMIDTNLIPGGTPKYDVQFQQPTPPWLIPSIIAGFGVVAVMMMNRRKTAR